VAVLPFRDFSPNKDQEYFCDGMTEAIIGQLTRIKQLKVISMTSVLQYKNLTPNIKQIGKDLGVATILEGSIRKEKDRIRVAAKLIKAADESFLWQKRFDLEFGSVFAIQDEISQSIVNVLKIRLLKKEKTELVKHHTRDTEAYNLYMLGRFFFRKRGNDVYKSIEYFEKAVEKDPDYALAYTGLSNAYKMLARWKVLSREESEDTIAGWSLKAKEYALKALELDNTLAEAHTSLGAIKLDYEWDLKGAQREFQRAVELNPGYAKGHYQYVFYFHAVADWNNAIAHLKRALELDPLYPLIIKNLGIVLFWAGEYDRAIDQLKKAAEMFPNLQDTQLFLGMAYLEKAIYREALKELKKERNFILFAEFFTMLT
jgi:TolB-like protein